MNQSLLEKISNESWKPNEDVKQTLKELTHQLKREKSIM